MDPYFLFPNKTNNQTNSNNGKQQWLNGSCRTQHCLANIPATFARTSFTFAFTFAFIFAFYALHTMPLLRARALPDFLIVVIVVPSPLSPSHPRIHPPSVIIIQCFIHLISCAFM